MDDRYQHQILPVRIYRWLRWKPYCFVRSLIPLVSRKITYKKWNNEILAIWMGWADAQMKHTYSAEEVFSKEIS